MDRTTWYNIGLEVSALEGETVYISGEEALVEKGRTAKKITVKKEAIEALPIKDVSELYNLQSGVVKIDSKAKGIPDHAERGLEEVHVRGGRSGEIKNFATGIAAEFGNVGEITTGVALQAAKISAFTGLSGQNMAGSHVHSGSFYINITADVNRRSDDTCLLYTSPSPRD